MIRASHPASDASAYAQRHGSATCRGINARPCSLAATVHCVTVTAVHHPIFARCYGLVSRFVEHDVGERRDELLAGLCGRVIEIGAGNGMNFRHYPVTTDEVVAVEPEGYLRHLADHAARDAPVPVSMRAGLAENLPLNDGEFDAGVASLVLCSVAEQTPALAELRRVLKPGGELRFFEHVRAEAARTARVQAGLDRFGAWPFLAGGCHCSRETVEEIESAGFEIERLRRFELGPSWVLTNPFVLGVARARG